MAYGVIANNKILILFSLVLLAACGPSAQDKKEIAIVTCNIMSESLNMNASMRIKEINEAREKIKGKRFLKGDAKIKESFEYGLCEELVMNDADYEIKLYEVIKAKNIKLEEERIEAERVKAELEEAERIEEYKNRNYYLTVEEESDRTITIVKWNYPGIPKFKEISTYLKESPLKPCSLVPLVEGNHLEGKSPNFREIYNQKGELLSRVTFQGRLNDNSEESLRLNCILDGVIIYKADFGDPPGSSGFQIISFKDGRSHGWHRAFYKNGLDVNTHSNYPTCYINGLMMPRGMHNHKCDNMKEFNYEEIYKSIKGEN